jgi:hypothetical protein
MNAQPASSPITPTAEGGLPMIGLLRVLLLLEAGLGLALAIALSVVAGEQLESLGGDSGRSAEISLRFAAAASFVFAIFAAIASRGARRRRGWAWTLAAILQVVIAVGTGIAVLTAEWHPVFLVGFGLAAAVMLVLSAPSVRRVLGKG